VLHLSNSFFETLIRRLNLLSWSFQSTPQSCRQLAMIFTTVRRLTERKNAACNNILLLAHKDHQKCYLVYLTLYQQYQWVFQDFKNLVTSNLQLQNKLAALHDSNQNIKTEKTGQTSSKKQELVKAEVQSSVVKLAQSEINMIQLTEDRGTCCIYFNFQPTQKPLSKPFHWR
jgi:hypothetical protein